MTDVANDKPSKPKPRRTGQRTTIVAEIQPDTEAIARAEDRMNPMVAMLDAGEIGLDDCEGLLEKWDREEGPIRPH